MSAGFFKQAQDRSVAGKERAREDDLRPPSPPSDHRRWEFELQTPVPSTLRPTLERGVTTAVSTPHDVVLAELFSHRQGPSVDRLDVPEVPSRKNEVETSHRAQSPGRTPLHDPFAGSLIGLSIQGDGDHAQNDRTEFEARKEELWSHVGNIRDIQTQIANMHVAMENIGLGHQADQLSVERVHSTTASEGEKWEDAVEGEDEEVKEKDAREQEFTKLANKFQGRKEATENIMTKLDELSRVVTAFHALRTPAADFCGSRSSKKGMLTGESGTAALDAPPLMIIPPPPPPQAQTQNVPAEPGADAGRQSG